MYSTRRAAIALLTALLTCTSSPVEGQEGWSRLFGYPGCAWSGCRVLTMIEWDGKLVAGGDW